MHTFIEFCMKMISFSKHNSIVTNNLLIVYDHSSLTFIQCSSVNKNKSTIFSKPNWSTLKFIQELRNLIKILKWRYLLNKVKMLTQVKENLTLNQFYNKKPILEPYRTQNLFFYSFLAKFNLLKSAGHLV